jgi:trigger factor
MVAGEAKTFTLTFPPDYHGKEVAGKAAEFAMTVQSVSEPKLPAVDAEFATRFGIAGGSIEELRAEIGANLTLELKRKIEGLLREQVLRALKSTSELVVPRSLVELEAQQLLNRAVGDLQSRGVKAEDVQLSVDVFRAQAEERVTYGLIVNEVTRVHQLAAKPEQVLALVREAAQAYEQPEAVIRWHYEKPERLNDFEAQAVEQNVVAWALALARVEDRPTTFAALMEPPTR